MKKFHLCKVVSTVVDNTGSIEYYLLVNDNKHLCTGMMCQSLNSLIKHMNSWTHTAFRTIYRIIKIKQTILTLDFDENVNNIINNIQNLINVIIIEQIPEEFI